MFIWRFGVDMIILRVTVHEEDARNGQEYHKKVQWSQHEKICAVTICLIVLVRVIIVLFHAVKRHKARWGKAVVLGRSIPVQKQACKSG